MSVTFDKAEAPTAAELPWTPYAVPRVNLLPPEIEAERTFKRTQLVLGGVTAGVVALLVGGFALAAISANQAEEELAAEAVRTQTLQTEEAKYADVPRVLAEVENAQNAQSTAMGTDVAWSTYLNQVAATYPQNLWLKDMSVTMAAPALTPTPGALGSDPLATPGIGAIAFNGTAKEHVDVASWLDALGAIDGFADPSYTNSARTEVEGQVLVDFTSQVVVTNDALTGYYERKAS